MTIKINFKIKKRSTFISIITKSNLISTTNRIYSADVRSPTTLRLMIPAMVATFLCAAACSLSFRAYFSAGVRGGGGICLGFFSLYFVKRRILVSIETLIKHCLEFWGWDRDEGKWLDENGFTSVRKRLVKYRQFSRIYREMFLWSEALVIPIIFYLNFLLTKTPHASSHAVLDYRLPALCLEALCASVD